MKNISVLKLIFVAFFVLKIAEVKPFSTWNWFLIFLPLFLYWIKSLFLFAWERMGLANALEGEIRMMKYSSVLKKSVKEFKKELENEK